MARAIAVKQNKLLVPDITSAANIYAPHQFYANGPLFSGFDPDYPELWDTPPQDTTGQTAPIGAGVPQPQQQPAPGGINGASGAMGPSMNPSASLFNSSGAAVQAARQQQEIARQRLKFLTDPANPIPHKEEVDFNTPYPTLQSATPYEPYSYDEERRNVKNASLPLSVIMGLFGGTFGRRALPGVFSGYAKGVMEQGKQEEQQNQAAYQMYYNNIKESNSHAVKQWEDLQELNRNQNIGVRDYNQNQRLQRDSEVDSAGKQLSVAEGTESHNLIAQRGEQAAALRYFGGQIRSLIESLDDKNITDGEIQNRIDQINVLKKSVGKAYGIEEGALDLEATKGIEDRLATSPYYENQRRDREGRAENALQMSQIKSEQSANQTEAQLRLKQANEISTRNFMASMQAVNLKHSQWNQAWQMAKTQIDMGMKLASEATQAKWQRVNARRGTINQKLVDVRLHRDMFEQGMLNARKMLTAGDAAGYKQAVIAAFKEASKANALLKDYNNDIKDWNAEVLNLAPVLPAAVNIQSLMAQFMDSMPSEMLDANNFYKDPNDIVVSGSTTDKKRRGEPSALKPLEIQGGPVWKPGVRGKPGEKVTPKATAPTSTPSGGKAGKPRFNPDSMGMKPTGKTRKVMR